MKTTEREKKNTYYRELAQFEEVEKVRLSLCGFTPNQFQEKYLEQWKEFLFKRPHYLYPDDLLLPHDMLAYEYKPHTESTASESYQNAERLLVAARDEYAEGLTRHYNQMCQNGSIRQVLAERLASLAVWLERYPVLQELSGNRYKVQLPTRDIEASAEPKEVGTALALLIHFLEVHKQFLAAEEAAPISSEHDQNLNAENRRILIISNEEAERRGKASLHNQNMIAKYSAIHGIQNAFNDYRYWHEEIEFTSANGSKIKEIHNDYPLPYCQKYFRRFVELFLSRHSDEYLLATLAHEFPTGDKVDADYVESLIRQAKDYNLFEKGGVIGFYGDEEFTFCTLNSGEYLSQIVQFNRISSDNIFYGSKANKSRVKAIRHWFKNQAKELELTSYKTVIATPKQSQPVSEEPKLDETVSEPSIKSSDLIKLCAEKIKKQIHFNIEPSEIATMAFHNLFDSKKLDKVTSHPVKFSNSNLRLFAIANALKLYKVITMPAPHFAALLGEAWGIKAGRRLYGISETYNDFFEPLKEKVLAMKTTSQTRMKSHQKAS